MNALRVGQVLTYQQTSLVHTYLVVQKVTKKGFVCYMLTKAAEGVTIAPGKVPMPASVLNRPDIREAPPEEIGQVFDRLLNEINDALEVLNTSIDEVDQQGDVAVLRFAPEVKRASKDLFDKVQTAENATALIVRTTDDEELRELLLS